MNKFIIAICLIIPNIIIQVFIRGGISLYVLGAMVGAIVLTFLAYLLIGFISTKMFKKECNKVLQIILAYVLYYGVYFVF